MSRVTVWHDGGCPLCRREIAMMRRLDRRGHITFVDATGPQACPLDRTELLARFHAREDGGPLLSGAAAFAAMWRAIPLLRPIGLLARNPPGARVAGVPLPALPAHPPPPAALALAIRGADVRPRPDPAGVGQESVWRFPRPAVAEPSGRHVRIEHRDVLVADTRAAVRTLEASHPPSWYLPPAGIAPGLLRASDRHSFCEWKGHAIYWHLEAGGEVLRDVAWSYPDPTRAFAILRDHVAFYAAPLDRCSVDGERVRPQPGSFYGGWITSDLAGPFKGVPGSMGW